MPENFHFMEKPGELQNKKFPMKEYREMSFEELAKNTRLFSDSEYRKIYAPAKKSWGINSPAFIFPMRYLARHPFPESIPPNLTGDLIAINKDAIPDPDYVKYITAHEHWEHYIDNKAGFNLGEYSTYDFSLPILSRRRPGHRFAVLKEFQIAEADGKLDEYMEWWRNYYQTNIDEIMSLPDEEINRISKNYMNNNQRDNREMIVLMIKKNLDLKEAIYKRMISKRKTN